MTRLISLLVVLFAFSAVYGQGQKFGIKAGLNFSTLLGPAELNVDDANKETNKFAPGFHLGPVFNYEFTDKVGFQVELLYSQKGNKYRFFSDSAYYNQFFVSDTSLVYSPDIWASGKKQTLININTGYLAIPASLFYNLTPNFRVGAGMELGILLNATGTGQTKLSNGVIRSGTNTGTVVDNFNVVLDYNYFKDEAGYPVYQVIDGQQMTIDGRNLLDPLFVERTSLAYNQENTDPTINPNVDAKMFKRIDLNANLDLAYIFSSGLYFNVRTSLGLLDATNNNLDYSRVSLTDPENGDLSRIRRADKDVSFSIQASVGFNF